MNLSGQKILTILFICFLAAFIGACNFAPYDGEAQIVLDLSWLFPSDGGTAVGARSGSVSGAGVPENIEGYVTSLEITVSGAGMNTTTRTYTKWPDRLYVKVEPGKQRTVGVRINIDPDSPSPVLAFGGEGTVRYVSAGQQAKVVIQLVPVESKLVVPDYRGGKVLQFLDINDLKPLIVPVGDLNLSNIFDIDLDSMGRVYFAIPGWNSVVRTADLHTPYNPDLPDTWGITFASPTAIAIDRYRDILYVSSGTTLSKYDISQANPAEITLDITGISTIYGMQADKNGLLYIAGQVGKEAAVFIYDPFYKSLGGGPDGRLVPDSAPFMSPNLVNSRDIVIQGNYVYMTNPGGNDGWLIVRLDKNLKNETGFGNLANVISISKGDFYGPQKFVSKMNNKLTIIDDANNLDKLVSINGIPCTTWETIPKGPGDNGQTWFQFYIDVN